MGISYRFDLLCNVCCLVDALDGQCVVDGDRYLEKTPKPASDLNDTAFGFQGAVDDVL